LLKTSLNDHIYEHKKTSLAAFNLTHYFDEDDPKYRPTITNSARQNEVSSNIIKL
jgi:hypothetical protein